MAKGKERVIQAAEECDEEGYEREDGKWVDPLPVQEAAIHEGFRAAAQEQNFDVWSVVNKDVALHEGKTLAENFERVFQSWSDTVERPEMKQAVMDRIEDIEQDEADE